jgi:hypothetical protein
MFKVYNFQVSPIQPPSRRLSQPASMAIEVSDLSTMSKTETICI